MLEPSCDVNNNCHDDDTTVVSRTLLCQQLLLCSLPIHGKHDESKTGYYYLVEQYHKRCISLGHKVSHGIVWNMKKEV